MASGHLWFVASLLVYSLVYILLFQSKIQPNTEKQFRTYYALIYIGLLSLVSGLVRIYYPIDTWRTWIIPVEVAHIPQYFSLFIIGTLFNRYQWLEKFKPLTGIYFFVIAIVTYFFQDALPEVIKNHWLTESILESLLCVGISMSLLTLFGFYGNKTNKVIQLLSENSFGIYLFHVFVVIGLQAMLLSFNWDANSKFALVIIGGIVISLLISHYFRKIKLVRNII